MTAILAILAPFWRPIAAIFGGLMAYLKGRSDAAAKADREAWEAAHEAERQRKDVDRDVRSGDARERLRRDWSRD